MLHAEEMVNNFESFLAFRIVGSADVHDALELALRVVSKESENGKDARRSSVERQFIFENRELLDEFGKALCEIRAVSVKGLGRLRVLGHGRVG